MFPDNFFNGAFVLVFGFLIGSFLNVVIYRLPQRKKILNLQTRSQCMHCHKKLSVFDLIPVLSYLWLRGKCRYCHKKISIQYPLVELVTALSFWSIFEFSQSRASFLLYIVAALLIVIFFIDLNTHYIYDITLWGLGGTSLLWVFFNKDLGIHLLSAILGGGFFYILAFLGEKIYKKQALGEGDIPLAANIALLSGPTLALISFYSAFIVGGMAALFLLLTGRVKRNGELPFAPFLILGWIIGLSVHAIKI